MAKRKKKSECGWLSGRMEGGEPAVAVEVISSQRKELQADDGQCCTQCGDK